MSHFSKFIIEERESVVEVVTKCG